MSLKFTHSPVPTKHCKKTIHPLQSTCITRANRLWGSLINDLKRATRHCTFGPLSLRNLYISLIDLHLLSTLIQRPAIRKRRFAAIQKFQPLLYTQKLSGHRDFRLGIRWLAARNTIIWEDQEEGHGFARWNPLQGQDSSQKPRLRSTGDSRRVDCGGEIAHAADVRFGGRRKSEPGHWNT